MTVSSDLAIETRGLTKRYATAQALTAVDLHVPIGSVYGFLGRNGAGKTTTIKTLVGMVRPSGGEGHVLRHPIADDRAGGEIRRRTAYVGEDRSLWPGMTVNQVLRISRPFFPRWRTDLEQRYLDSFEIPRHQHVGRVCDPPGGDRARGVERPGVPPVVASDPPAHRVLAPVHHCRTDCGTHDRAVAAGLCDGAAQGSALSSRRCADALGHPDGRQSRSFRTHHVPR